MARTAAAITLAVAALAAAPGTASALGPDTVDILARSNVQIAGARSGDIDVHDDARDAVDGTGSEFRIASNRGIAHAAREFHDAVMNLDANGAGNDIRFTIKPRDHVPLNLHVVFHQAIPFSLSDGAYALEVRMRPSR